MYNCSEGWKNECLSVCMYVWVHVTCKDVSNMYVHILCIKYKKYNCSGFINLSYTSLIYPALYISKLRFELFFLIKVDPLNLGQSVKRFLSYDRTYKQADRDYNFLYIDLQKPELMLLLTCFFFIFQII